MPSLSEIGTIMDKGILSFLFVAVFLYFIYRGIPAIIELLKESLNKINAEHTNQILIISKTFESSIEKIMNQIEEHHKENVSSIQECHKKIEFLKTRK